MKYDELKKHAETCQMAADEMAHDFIDYLDKSGELAKFQSHCDFNLFWIYSIAPEVVIHIKSVEFLNKNSNNFKRKLKLKELFRFDFIINHFDIGDWNRFKEVLSGDI